MVNTESIQNMMTEQLIKEQLIKLFEPAARLHELRQRIAITTAEAAELIGYSPDTLRNWRNNKKGPRYYRVDKRTIMYRVQDIEAWLLSK